MARYAASYTANRANSEATNTLPISELARN